MMVNKTIKRDYLILYVRLSVDSCSFQLGNITISIVDVSTLHFHGPKTGADPGILERGDPVRGRSPEPSALRRERWRGASPENFEKLDAISCNLAYIFGIRMASDIIQNGAFAEQKTVAATISIHTHTRIHPLPFKNSSHFGHYKIQIQFQTFFSDIVYNVENKIAENRGARAPLDPPLHKDIVRYLARLAQTAFTETLKCTCRRCVQQTLQNADQVGGRSTGCHCRGDRFSQQQTT